MEQLIQELAKTLNIGNDTLQSLIQNYPQLRQQLIAYNITDMIGTFSASTGFVAFILFVLLLFWEDGHLNFWSRLLGISAVSLVIIALISYSLKYALAPDIVFIQTILGGTT